MKCWRMRIGPQFSGSCEPAYARVKDHPCPPAAWPSLVTFLSRVFSEILGGLFLRVVVTYCLVVRVFLHLAG